MQEFGTRHHPAQPFMRPAWDARVKDALDRLIAELRNAIENAARRGRK
jgi:HK97 gp10 family phage protein